MFVFEFLSKLTKEVITYATLLKMILLISLLSIAVTVFKKGILTINFIEYHFSHVLIALLTTSYLKGFGPNNSW